MKAKTDLSPSAPRYVLNKMTRKIERVVCDIAVILMSLGLAWELQEKIEKAMEC